MDTNRHMVVVINNAVQFSSSLYINNIASRVFLYHVTCTCVIGLRRVVHPRMF